MSDPITYYTHDNGGKPFKVQIHPNNVVDIYRQDDDAHDLYHFTLTVHPQKVFVGKSRLNSMTKYSGGHGSEFDGNSILLELDSNTYEFIGNKIFTFTTLVKIVSYESPVGNNDVPYPYAIDEHGNIYLLLEDVVLKYITELSTYSDPYKYYYNLNLITKDDSYVPSKNPIVHNFNGIKKFYIGGNKYTLRYVPNPESDYDRLKSALGNLTIVCIDKNVKLLTKTKYVQLMKQFETVIGVEPFMSKELVF